MGLSFFFFFNDTATTEIYTLSLHDALPISRFVETVARRGYRFLAEVKVADSAPVRSQDLRSEEHTSELQSQSNLVCRLLLEKKKKHRTTTTDAWDIHSSHAPEVTVTCGCRD